MNIVHIHTHDMGKVCQSYGYKVKTPNIQSLAEESVLFNKHFCIAPTCSPSRAVFMTGQYPHQNGMFGLAGKSPWRLNDYNKHLSAFLKSNGFETVLVGMHHEDGAELDNFKNTYDYLLNVEHTKEFEQYKTTDMAIEYLNQKHTKPFFISIGYNDNHHANWDRTNEYMKKNLGIEVDPRYVSPLPHLPNTKEIREETAKFFCSIEYVDIQVGKLIAALREQNLYDNSLIIFTTDHGIGLPYAKLNLTDNGTGVAFILKTPNNQNRGVVIEALTTHLDVYPTICEYADIQKPDWLEGKSLLPLIGGIQEELHSEIYLEQNFHGGYGVKGSTYHLRGVRTNRYKYIRNYEIDKNKAYFTTDGGAAFEFLMENGYESIVYEKEQLYDLYFDTQEMNNVIYDSKYTKVSNELRDKLELWQETKKDTFGG